MEDHFADAVIDAQGVFALCGGKLGRGRQGGAAVHNDLADASTGNLLIRALKNRPLDGVNHRLNLLDRDRAFVARTKNTVLDLRTVISFSCLILLDDT